MEVKLILQRKKVSTEFYGKVFKKPLNRLTEIQLVYDSKDKISETHSSSPHCICDTMGKGGYVK
jgi:hypothetical protein